MDENIYKLLINSLKILYGPQYNTQEKFQADKYLTQFIDHPQAIDYAEFIIGNNLPGIYKYNINRSYTRSAILCIIINSKNNGKKMEYF